MAHPKATHRYGDGSDPLTTGGRLMDAIGTAQSYLDSGNPGAALAVLDKARYRYLDSVRSEEYAQGRTQNGIHIWQVVDAYQTLLLYGTSAARAGSLFIFGNAGVALVSSVITVPTASTLTAYGAMGVVVGALTFVLVLRAERQAAALLKTDAQEDE